MSPPSLEERLAALEAEVAHLKARLNGSSRPGVTGYTDPQALDAMFGMFANDAGAQAVLDAIEAERERDAARASDDAE